MIDTPPSDGNSMRCSSLKGPKSVSVMLRIANTGLASPCLLGHVGVDRLRDSLVGFLSVVRVVALDQNDLLHKLGRDIGELALPDLLDRFQQIVFTRHSPSSPFPPPTTPSSSS